MSRDRKNKCRLGFTQAVEELYDAVEDNVRSRLAVKDRFAKVENTFQAYKEACGAYAVRLESFGEVDTRAKLAAECTRMKSRYHDCVKVKEATTQVSLKFSVDRETADVTKAIDQLFLGTSATVERPNYVENSGEKSDTEQKRISAEMLISEKPEECRAYMYQFPRSSSDVSVPVTVPKKSALTPNKEMWSNEHIMGLNSSGEDQEFVTPPRYNYHEQASKREQLEQWRIYTARAIQLPPKHMSTPCAERTMIYERNLVLKIIQQEYMSVMKSVTWSNGKDSLCHNIVFGLEPVAIQNTRDSKS